MATAICGQCSDVLHWHTRRGVRLADIKCDCGGAYKAAVWTEHGYKARETQAVNKGRTKAECLCCGRSCLLREKTARIVKMVLWNIGLDARNWAQAVWTIQIQPGDAICSRCRPWEYLSSYRLGIETHDWLYKQLDGAGVNYYFPLDDELSREGR
jgi:hypothetical protein